MKFEPQVQIYSTRAEARTSYLTTLKGQHRRLISDLIAPLSLSLIWTLVFIISFYLHFLSFDYSQLPALYGYRTPETLC